jgi:hypothetical protein
LDDKDRTEKILGQEYATMFFNECSQIPWSSRNMAITRLAQKTPLRLKAFYDCNPPSEAHWTARVFVGKEDPDTRKKLTDPERFASIVMNPTDNLENLPADYLKELDALPPRMRRGSCSASFKVRWIMRFGRLKASIKIESGRQAARHAADHYRSRSLWMLWTRRRALDEVGIIVAGLGVDGKGIRP